MPVFYPNSVLMLLDRSKHILTALGRITQETAVECTRRLVGKYDGCFALDLIAKEEAIECTLPLVGDMMAALL